MPKETSIRIPDWSVQQAHTIEQYPVKPGTPFALTEKLNGVRATYLNGKLVSRSGRTFSGMQHIIEPLCRVFGHNYVFDGELVLTDKQNMRDNEAFRAAAGIVNSDADDKTAVSFVIFDVTLSSEFCSNTGTIPYFKRREFLDSAVTTLLHSKYVRVHPLLYRGTDQSQINILLDKMVEEDKEGLMVNLDVPYQRRRHRGVLKVKRFYTMDLPITAVEEGSGRLAGTLGSLTLDFNGNPVSVGTGFSDEERNALWSRRKSLPGILCEVKYKEVTKTKAGQSLQFPVFVRLREDKTDISYD